MCSFCKGIFYYLLLPLLLWFCTHLMSFHIPPGLKLSSRAAGHNVRGCAVLKAVLAVTLAKTALDFSFDTFKENFKQNVLAGMEECAKMVLEEIFAPGAAALSMCWKMFQSGRQAWKHAEFLRLSKREQARAILQE